MIGEMTIQCKNKNNVCGLLRYLYQIKKLVLKNRFFLYFQTKSRVATTTTPSVNSKPKVRPS